MISDPHSKPSETSLEKQALSFIDRDHEVRHHISESTILEFLGYGHLDKTLKQGLAHVIEKAKRKACLERKCPLAQLAPKKKKFLDSYQEFWNRLEETLERRLNGYIPDVALSESEMKEMQSSG